MNKKIAGFEGIYYIIKIKRTLRYFIQKMKTGKVYRCSTITTHERHTSVSFWGEHVCTGNQYLGLRAIYFVTHGNLCEYNS